jgi:UPF0271 protein
VAGLDPFSIFEEQYTVPKVKDEIGRNSMAWVRFKTAIDRGKLKIKAPENIFVEKVRDVAISVGNHLSLSETDIQILALALQLKTQGCETLVATDDYSIQNVTKHLGISFASLATFGIRLPLKWVRYCPACHKRYPPDYESRKCEICGTDLKRKPLRK